MLQWLQRRGWGGTTKLQPQQLFFRKTVKNLSFSTFFRDGRGDECCQTLTEPLNAPEPLLSKALFGEA